MADDLSLRACGETPRGSHGGHQYMLDGTLYVCPGGYVLHDIRAGTEPGTACAVLHKDRNGNTIPCPGYHSLLDGVPVSGEHTWQPDGTAEIVQPCPGQHHRIPHDAHDWADSFGPARCPGYSEPEDGPGPQPGTPQTDTERIQNLQHILQRVREVVGTDMALVSCEQHTAQIKSLEGALREVLAMFAQQIEEYRVAGALSTNTVRRWHNALDGLDEEGRPS